MPKYILFFFVFILAVTAHAQTEKDLIGTWKVAEVTMDKSSPYANSPMFLKLKEQMLKE